MKWCSVQKLLTIDNYFTEHHFENCQIISLNEKLYFLLPTNSQLILCRAESWLTTATLLKVGSSGQCARFTSASAGDHTNPYFSSWPHPPWRVRCSHHSSKHAFSRCKRKTRGSAECKVNHRLSGPLQLSWGGLCVCRMLAVDGSTVCFNFPRRADYTHEAVSKLLQDHPLCFGLGLTSLFGFLGLFKQTLARCFKHLLCNKCVWKPVVEKKITRSLAKCP